MSGARHAFSTRPLSTGEKQRKRNLAYHATSRVGMSEHFVLSTVREQLIVRSSLYTALAFLQVLGRRSKSERLASCFGGWLTTFVLYRLPILTIPVDACNDSMRNETIAHENTHPNMLQGYLSEA